jgi:exopolysaccharide biosynthesis polyprenyl glycosylphosphotransferase
MLNRVNHHSFVHHRRADAVADLPLAQAAFGVGLGVALAEAGIVAAVILLGLGREGLATGVLEAGMAGLFGLAATLLVHPMHGYEFARLRQPDRTLPQLVGLAALSTAAGMAIIAAHTADHVLDAWSVLLAIAVLAVAQASLRLIVAVVLQRTEQRGGLRRRVAVLDLSSPEAPLEAKRLLAKLATERGCACALEVVRAEPDSMAAAEAAVEAVRWAEEIVVVAAPEATSPARLDRLLEALEIVPVPVTLAVPVTRTRADFAMSRVHEAPLGPAARAAKRLADIVIATAMLVFLGPLLCIVALAVKLDSPGPVFFRQIRRGYNNRSFDALKFRSLRHEMADPLANRLVTRDDPRVTRVGAFLRRSSIDELPQLLNVLKGDMSLVGPRPHPLNAKAGGRPYEEVVERFQRRYRVRPGITGWAQVNGLRGNTETEDDLLRRVDFDLDYIRRWSLWLDLLILLRTPLATLKGENAC